MEKKFEILLPEVKVFDAPCESLDGVHAGVYSPANLMAIIPAYSIEYRALP